MKVKMNIWAATNERVYNHHEIYEVGKNITEKLADEFIRIGYAAIVEEEKNEKPKRVAKKNKVKADEN